LSGIVVEVNKWACLWHKITNYRKSVKWNRFLDSTVNNNKNKIKKWQLQTQQGESRQSRPLVTEQGHGLSRVIIEHHVSFPYYEPHLWDSFL
jgi:hypothetical protein